MTSFQMQWRLLLAVAVGASASFLSTPANQFRSGFLGDDERLLKPIVIPDLPEQPRGDDASGEPRGQETEEAILEENFTEEENKAGKNPLKFSSRYSSKPDLDEKVAKDVKGTAAKEGDTLGGGEREAGNATATADAAAEDQPPEEEHKFSERSDDPQGLSEEEDEGESAVPRRFFDSSEPEDAEEAEESEASPTTTGPYPELRRPRPEGEPEDYKTSPASGGDDSEEEAGGALGDPRDSGSKNYHSIQTPLSKIHFRGPHAFKDDLDSGKTRTRLISPIGRRPVGYRWPYSKAQAKAERDKSNEIADEEDDWKPDAPETKLAGLELAAEKDEAKFGLHLQKPYDHVEERNRAKQKHDALVREEDKDHVSPFFRSLQNYRVDEVEQVPPPKVKFGEKPKSKPKQKVHEGVWSAGLPKSDKGKAAPHKPPPKSKARPSATDVAPAKFNITRELSSGFPGHQFLGPVVFKQHVDHRRPRPTAQPRHKASQPLRNIFLKDLEEKEKLDQGNLANQRIQTATPAGGKLSVTSFNHLEESDLMYNAILANIQSVFGIRTQPSKAGAAHRKATATGSLQEINLEENRSLTWSYPLLKRRQAPEGGAPKGAESKTKTGVEGRLP